MIERSKLKFSKSDTHSSMKRNSKQRVNSLCLLNNRVVKYGGLEMKFWASPDAKLVKKTEKLQAVPGSSLQLKEYTELKLEHSKTGHARYITMAGTTERSQIRTADALRRFWKAAGVNTVTLPPPLSGLLPRVTEPSTARAAAARTPF